MIVAKLLGKFHNEIRINVRINKKNCPSRISKDKTINSFPTEYC